MIVTLPARHGARVRTEDARYLALEIAGRLVVVPDRCKHRGGPLGLGEWDPVRECMTCPWHRLRNGASELLARALPAVRRGDSLVAVVPPATKE